jgi:hypothetical protein
VESGIARITKLLPRKWLIINELQYAADVSEALLLYSGTLIACQCWGGSVV